MYLTPKRKSSLPLALTMSFMSTETETFNLNYLIQFVCVSSLLPTLCLLN